MFWDNKVHNEYPDEYLCPQREGSYILEPSNCYFAQLNSTLRQNNLIYFERNTFIQQILAT
jgi:hypothetical protein